MPVSQRFSSGFAPATSSRVSLDLTQLRVRPLAERRSLLQAENTLLDPAAPPAPSDSEAIAEAERNLGVSGTRGHSMLAFVLARAGRGDEARRILATLLDRAARADDGSAIDVAIVYAALGENDEAFVWLDRSISDRSFELSHREDLLASLESDPRYENIRAKLGIQKR